jgi:predicted neuraminidase
MRILANELILPFREGMNCHASHFVTLGEGRVYCVYFYGTREGNDDVRIYGSLRNPDGSWSDPEPLSEDDGLPHWNPVLFRRRDGAVMLFYKVGRPIPDWKTRCRISYDDCKTWGESFELVAGDESGGRGPVRNKAIYLSDGSILAPGSTERGEWMCFFDRSTDEGRTWQRSADVRIPGLEGATDGARKGIIQPTLWQTAQGVHALMRSSEGRVYRTDSPDGITWSPARPLELPNNNSGIDAALLPDGRVVLACNPVGDDWGKRSPISLYVSHDNGETFSLLTHLTTMPGEFSYPAVRYENGLLHVTYTWKRVNVQYFCLAEI